MQIFRLYCTEKIIITILIRTTVAPMTSIRQTEHLKEDLKAIKNPKIVEEDLETIEADITEKTSERDIKITTKTFKED